MCKTLDFIPTENNWFYFSSKQVEKEKLKGETIYLNE